MTRIPVTALAFLGFSLLSSSSFADDKTPTYKKPLPKHVCITATKLDQRTGSCNDNGVFLKSAKQCWTDVTKLTDQIAKEVKGQGGPAGGDSQTADFLSSQAKSAEAIAAQTYILGLQEVALADLDKYFDYVVRPDEAESDAEILRTSCYRDAVMPLDQLTEQIEKKIAETKKTISALEENFAVASDRRVQIGSTVGGSMGSVSGAGVGSGAPSATPKAAPAKNGASSITGVEEDAKKRKPKK